MDRTGNMSTTYGTSGAAPRNFGDASAKAHESIDNVSARAKPVVDRVAAGAHQAVEKVAIAASDIVGSLAVKTDQLVDLQDRLTEQCRRYAREKPLAAVAIALASGFVLSRLLSRH